MFFNWCVGFAVLGASAQSNASIQGVAEEFTGSNARVTVSLQDIGAGEVEVTAEVDTSVSTGDIRGLFFDISDNTLLSTITAIDGTPESTLVFQTDTTGSLLDLGNGVNLNGGGASNPGGFELGVAIGDNSTKSSLIMFTLKSTDLSFNKSVFANQKLGVRLQSVGAAGFGGGSSKLNGVLDDGSTQLQTPEPTTIAIWSLFGLFGVGMFRRNILRGANQIS